MSRVYISRDGIFNEQDFGHKSEILKQDSSEILVHLKLETQSLVLEHQQETERCNIINCPLNQFIVMFTWYCAVQKLSNKQSGSMIFRPVRLINIIL